MVRLKRKQRRNPTMHVCEKLEWTYTAKGSSLVVVLNYLFFYHFMDVYQGPLNGRAASA